jgi:hypothetical protein
MASQITHLVLAVKMSDRLFDKFDQDHFLVGTLFPDIRYLKVIEREKTHFERLSIQDILDERNSFIAGLKYHSLVDEVREKHMIKNNMYAVIPSSMFITQALKMYEDELLYSNIPNWKLVSICLDEVLLEEVGMVAQPTQVKRWHFLMREYFKNTPTDESRKNFIIGVGFTEEIAFEINQLINKMRKITEVRETVLNLYEHWNSLI